MAARIRAGKLFEATGAQHAPPDAAPDPAAGV